MQKCIDRGPEMQIRSAVALDHLKNYIYIEADKEAHVREVYYAFLVNKLNSIMSAVDQLFKFFWLFMHPFCRLTVID